MAESGTILGPPRGWRRALLPGYVVIVIAYTLVPIAVMVLYGFNQAPTTTEVAATSARMTSSPRALARKR